MDTQFDWLVSVPSDSSSQSSNGGAPPIVSFGFEGETGRPHASQLGSFSHLNGPSEAFSEPVVPVSAGVPLSLQAQELTLDESKTYMRWYLDILARTNLRTIAISDVYHFLGNFKISAETKKKINRIFVKILLLINIGEFFAVLRVVSHALQGTEPTRALIKTATRIPVPPSILSKKRQNEEPESELDDEQTYLENPADAQDTGPLDIDLFTQFMLTGERPNERPTLSCKKLLKLLKKLKSVKFSDEIFTDIQEPARPAESPMSLTSELDFLLPMNQLLSRINASTPTSPAPAFANSLAVPAYEHRVTSPDAEEREILKDMEPQMNRFQNLHSVDTILVDGVPSNIYLRANLGFQLPLPGLPQPPRLKPNMTGPAQMALMTLSSVSAASSNTPLVNNWTLPLLASMTGPQDIARIFAPSNEDSPKISLQAFTSQMTGTTMDNTQQNMMIGHEHEHEHDYTEIGTFHRPPVPATRRVRSVSQPSPLDHPWANAGSMQANLVNLTANLLVNLAGMLRANENHLYTNFPSVHVSANGTGTGTGTEQTKQPGPPVPPRSLLAQSQTLRLKPPPPRSRRAASQSGSSADNSPPASSGTVYAPPLPAKIPKIPTTSFYQNPDASSSTANILDDLKALQEEVDKIRDSTGGF